MNKEKQREYRRKYYQKHKEKIKKQNKLWAINNPEKMRAYRKKWNKDHPEQCRQLAKQWKKENPEKVKMWTKKWYKKNSDKARAASREWAKKNPERRREYQARRRSGGSRVERDVFKKIINNNMFKYGIITCEKCKKECEDNYHIDHVIPVSKDGLSDYGNLQVLCAHCNITKDVNVADYREKQTSGQLFIN